MLTGLLCVALGTAWAGNVNDLRNDWSGEYDTPGNVSITLSPLRLGYARAPMLDVTVELRTGDTRSIAFSGATSIAWTDANRQPLELGFQVRDYLVGTFDNGLFLGAHAGVTNPEPGRFRADRTTFGPMAGVKVTLSIFTVQTRGGASFGIGPKGFTAEPMVDFTTGVTF